MKHVLGLVLLFCISSVSAQSSIIKFNEEEISIDGKLDEVIWSKLPVYTGFYNYMPIDEGLASNQTQVKIFHDREYLYVAAVYNDTTEKAQVSTLKRDVSIALSDAFVMILDSHNQEQNAYFFAVNAFGNQTDGLIERVNEGYGLNFSWNAVWESNTTLNGYKKQYEIAIPLKALNFDSNNAVFGIQFYVRDIKNNTWTILKNVKRNYPNFDLRFTEKFSVENLRDQSIAKFTATPSITTNYQEDIIENFNNITFKPSLDVQYNLSSSLKMDATINPDFSQIEVDQQVTNLTRFSVFFPERRNFFLENSDLFSNLGVDEVNPFYSRRIGANGDIQFGLKLSGNISPKTRIGILNVQTNQEDDVVSENFGTLVAEQQLSKNFTGTAFLINRQQTKNFNLVDNYNRVTGINLNYKSDNNKWVGLTNFGKSFSDGISRHNSFYNAGIWFNERGLEWNVGIKNIGKNYVTDVGFTPRLYNYDAINDLVIREGYAQITSGLEYQKFYEHSSRINSVRYLNYNNSTYFNDDGRMSQSSHFLNSAVFFKDLSSIYYVYKYDIIDLKYGFDPLRNGSSLTPKEYRFGVLKVGYNSANNQRLRYRLNGQKGTYYNGTRVSAGAYLNYQLLPFANLEMAYDVNSIELEELGKKTFHLARFTGEVFFNNKLNWTTYIQYNTQRNNFNINSRLQWEYEPLSYMYFVVTDNYNIDIQRKNWGIALKINYRLDF